MSPGLKLLKRPIPLEHQARLFDRFYRTDNSRARDSGGSGLGLALVSAIVTLHGGTVRLQSDAHVGTRFTLCFRRSCDADSKAQLAEVNARRVGAEAL